MNELRTCWNTTAVSLCWQQMLRMCVWSGCGSEELMHWWNGALKAASSLPFVSPFFHHPILPHEPAGSSSSSSFSSLSPSISATIALSAIWSPKHSTPPSSVCVSSPSRLPSCLSPSPWLAAVARHQGQISPSLSSSVFLFSPSIDSPFPVLCRSSQISVSACLARFIFCYFLFLFLLIV